MRNKKFFFTLIMLICVFSLLSFEKASAEIISVEEDPYTYYEDFDFIKIYTGGNHSAGITSDGRIYTWGSNMDGQLGGGIAIRSFRTTPIDITKHFNLSDGENIIDLSLGYNHTAALTNKGRIFTWGDNNFGQLGFYSSNRYTSPIDITNKFNLST